MQTPIIAALDLPSSAQALALAHSIKPYVGAVKIGSELFTSAGPSIVQGLSGVPIFLDLKFHDIPNTVAKSVAVAVRLGVAMLTVHTAGGSEMLKAAEVVAQQTAQGLGVPAPLVLGVTVLTSMDTNELNEIGVSGQVAQQVERLANLAVASGLRGLVCSPLEVSMLRQIVPSDFILVTPGIRTGREGKDDQKRTLTPQEALAAGANWLVIGRPIYGAPDPAAAARQIAEELGSK